MITVTTDGVGVVSHVGFRILAGMADRTGLTEAFRDALAGLRERRSGHDPGRVLTDLAVLLADGGRSISDLAVLRDQPTLFGPVASTATAWRVLARSTPRCSTGCEPLVRWHVSSSGRSAPRPAARAAAPGGWPDRTWPLTDPASSGDRPCFFGHVGGIRHDVMGNGA